MGSGQGEREEGTPEGRKTVVFSFHRREGGFDCRPARNTECEGGGGGWEGFRPAPPHPPPSLITELNDFFSLSKDIPEELLKLTRLRNVSA